jgi:hypothetical protein
MGRRDRERRQLLETGQVTPVRHENPPDTTLICQSCHTSFPKSKLKEHLEKYHPMGRTAQILDLGVTHAQRIRRPAGKRAPGRAVPFNPQLNTAK